MQVSGNAWDEILHYLRHSTLPSLSSNEFECIFNFNCSKRLRTVGIGKRGSWQDVEMFFTWKNQVKTHLRSFPLSLVFFFIIASLGFNQHWQKRRENLHFFVISSAWRYYTPAGRCLLPSFQCSTLSLAAPFRLIMIMMMMVGVLWERKWTEKRWRWAEKKRVERN